MKSAQGIVDSISKCIGQAYREPEDMAADFGELDRLLFQLHWLFADAHETLD